MPQSPRHRSLVDFATMSAPEVDALVAQARELQQRRHDAAPLRRLNGKNLAVLCATSLADGAAVLESAATALGARVVCLQPGLSEDSGDAEVRRIASMLSRLYDAVDCECMAPALVRRVGAEVGVPIFEGMASPAHPLAALAERLGPDTPALDRRCLMIQAALLRVMA